MKTRTNQPVYKDNGELLKDSDVLPSIASGDAGKVLMVNEDEDAYELGTASGGTKLYKHVISDNNYTFILYNNSSTRFDSHPYQDLGELFQEMLNTNIVAIYDGSVGTLKPCLFDGGTLYSSTFWNGEVSYVEVDDFSIENFTDTVTEL